MKSKTTLHYRNARDDAKALPAGDPWRFHSRGVLLLLLFLLPIIGAVFYAGPKGAEICYRLIVDGGVLVLWLAAALGLGLIVMRAARLWERQTPGALQWATAAALGLGVESLAVLGLGLAGWLNGIVAWGLLIVGWAAGAYSLKTWEREVGTLALGRWLKEPAAGEWLWLLATPFLMLVLVGAMAPPGMLWSPSEPHGYDVVEYHLQVPREWFEAQRIIPLEHNVFSYFPFNVEMHYLLAMHLRGGPLGAMYLAQLMHGVFIALSVLAVYGIAARRTRPTAAVIAALALLTVPWLTQLASIAYDEGGFLLFGILAIGWSIEALFDCKNRLRRFALAGAMAGLAAGSKLTAVPEILVAVPVVAGAAALWLGISRREPAEGRGRWTGILLFCLAGLLCFSPWLLRNLAWAKNPVFPELMPMLGKDHFNDAQVQRWEAAHKPPPAQRSFGGRAAALRDEVLLGWQFGYLLLPLGVICLGLSLRRPQAWFLFGLLLILTCFWLGFTHLQSRFFLLAAPIAALLVAQADGLLQRCLDSRWGTAGAALLVGVFAAIAWRNTNEALFGKLYGPGSNYGVVALGIDKLNWLSTDRFFPDGLPDNGTLVLVGDARAFWYSGVPMSRLRYRTVFDVKDDGPDIITAWAGQDATRAATWWVIDPAELYRFSTTYLHVRKVPEAWKKEPAYQKDR